MMVQLDDGALLIMPVLLLPAANRQHMIEANGGVLLPELQHRLQWLLQLDLTVDHDPRWTVEMIGFQRFKPRSLSV